MLLEDWPVCRLGDLIEEYRVKSTTQDQHEVLTSSRNGLVPQTEYYGGGRIVSRENVGFHVIPPNYLTYRSRSDDGNFFINMNTLGRFGIVSHFYPVFRFKNGDDRFFLEYLNYNRAKLGVHSVGSSQRVLSLNALRNIELPLPPRSERTKIADILFTWDQAIETEEALIANARAKKRALIQSLLSAKKRLPGYSGVWNQLHFGQFAQAISSKVDPRKLPDCVQGIELEHIESRSGRLMGTCKANEQVSLKTPFTSQHVLYGKLRPYLRKFLQPHFDGVCSTEIWVFAAQPNVCLPEYLHLIVQTATFETAVDVSSGSKMPRADWGIVRDTVFKVPATEEQAAIVALIANADAVVSIHESQSAALRREKQALMQQLFSGSRRVRVDQREAA